MRKQTCYIFPLSSYLTKPCSPGTPVLFRTCSQSFWQPSQLFPTAGYPRARAKLKRRNYTCHQSLLLIDFTRLHGRGKLQGKSWASSGLGAQCRACSSSLVPTHPPMSPVQSSVWKASKLDVQKNICFSFRWTQSSGLSLNLGLLHKTDSQRNLFPLLSAEWIPGKSTHWCGS